MLPAVCWWKMTLFCVVAGFVTHHTWAGLMVVHLSLSGVASTMSRSVMVWGWSRCRPTTPVNSTCEHNIDCCHGDTFPIPTYLCYWVGFFLSLVVGCLSTLLIQLDSFSGLLNSCRQLRTMERRWKVLFLPPSPFLSPPPPFPLLHFTAFEVTECYITSWWCNVYTHTPGAHHWSHPAASVYENLQLELCQDCQQVSHVWWYDVRWTEEVVITKVHLQGLIKKLTSFTFTKRCPTFSNIKVQTEVQS